MMNKLFVIALIILLFSLFGCSLDDADTLSRKEIRDLMYDISLDFSLGNLYGIMDKVHPEYLHKGNVSYHLNQELRNRMARFTLLDIDVIYIELEGHHALVHTIDRYSSSIENVDYHEPENYGWMSYLKYDRGSWLIYGNQQWLSSKTREKAIGPTFELTSGHGANELHLEHIAAKRN